MVIRKLYRIESAHTVRNAVSERCSQNYHGHSGVIEVFLKSNHLDNAGMVYDFGAFKNTIGSLIDMFDHSVHLWKDDDPECIEFFKKHNKRWIVLPCNSTAENYCVLFRDLINEVLLELHMLNNFQNGEGAVYCSGVRYHETTTGYAESDESDPVLFHFKDVEFSHQTLIECSPEISYIVSLAKDL